MKPTLIMLSLTQSRGQFTAINTQDLRHIRVFPREEKAIVVTSQATLTLKCMTESRLKRLVKDIRDRYNVIHLPGTGAEAPNKENNTIVAIDHGDSSTTYVWPKAMFCVAKRGGQLHIYGFKLKCAVDIPVHVDFTPETFTRFDGFVRKD